MVKITKVIEKMVAKTLIVGINSLCDFLSQGKSLWVEKAFLYLFSFFLYCLLPRKEE